MVHFIELYLLRHEGSPQTGGVGGAGMKWARRSPITSLQMAAGVGLRLPTMEPGNASCEQIILRRLKTPASRSRLFSSSGGEFRGSGSFSPHVGEFDLQVWPAYLNCTTWGDSVSACRARGLIKEAIKLFVGDFEAFVSLHMNPKLNLSSPD